MELGWQVVLFGINWYQAPYVMTTLLAECSCLLWRSGWELITILRRDMDCCTMCIKEEVQSSRSCQRHAVPAVALQGLYGGCSVDQSSVDACAVALVQRLRDPSKALKVVHALKKVREAEAGAIWRRSLQVCCHCCGG